MIEEHPHSPRVEGKNQDTRNERFQVGEIGTAPGRRKATEGCTRKNSNSRPHLSGLEVCVPGHMVWSLKMNSMRTVGYQFGEDGWRGKKHLGEE